MVVGLVVRGGGRSFAGGECSWWWDGRCCVVGGWLGVLFAPCLGTWNVLRWCGEGVYEVSYECV